MKRSRVEFPYYTLQSALDLPLINSNGKNTLHWFRSKDLRVEDNTSFYRAMKLSKDCGGKCYTLFVLNRNELKSHCVGDARNFFMQNQLKYLQAKLRSIGVLLSIAVVDSVEDVAVKVVEFAKRFEVTHVFANYEYENDELKRDILTLKRLKNAKIDFRLFHDQTIAEPGSILSTSKKPLKVFTPFWHKWISTIEDSYCNLQNPISQDWVKADESEVPILTENGNDLWPVGYEAAVDRLKVFLNTKIANYHRDRSNAALDCTSRMSPYIAMGVISIREVLKLTRELANNNKRFKTDFTGNGVDCWVREIAFREFYRQMVACCVPQIIRNIPSMSHLQYVKFERDEEGWKRWCEGTTGYPFVDAGMRQLNAEGFMHNRLRMNVSSYLRMNLLIDYRRGLNYFANKLVDWDPCNNAFGWDPNYTVFNPVLQAEKNDPKGDYIRKWVPELKDVQGKAIFDPYNRLPADEFKKLNYPAPTMSLKDAKERALLRFKQSNSK